MDAHVTPFLRGKRPVPGGSTIAGLRSDAEPLADAEMVANLLIILFGGIETTESAIASQRILHPHRPPRFRSVSLRGTAEHAPVFIRPICGSLHT